MPQPTVSTEWASDVGALVLEPTAIHYDRGWDTSDGTEGGVAVKPTLQHQNGWQKNVHEWLQFAVSDLGISSILPVGTILPVSSNLTGSYPMPGPGVVTDGWMVCDGSAIPPGEHMSGNTPDLTGNIFLQGSLTSGLTGGSNTRALTATEMPQHRHTSDSYASSRSGTFASSVHSHTVSNSFCRIPFSYTVGTRVQTVFHFNATDHPTWSSNFRTRDLNISNSGQFFSETFEVSGGTSNSSASTGLGGSNSVTGTSGSYGSGAVYQQMPVYISVRYLLYVGKIVNRPTSSTEWAVGATALQIQPTSANQERGWDTDTGDTSGDPSKPSLAILNGWRKNVHEWIQYIADITDFISLVPAGALMPVNTSIVGSYVPPLTGVVQDGWMICDGAVIPGGQTLSGNTPVINADTFLMGSITSGLTGGVNSRILDVTTTPAHTHGAGTFATSLSGSFASATHTHAIGSNIWIPFNSDGQTIRWRNGSNGWGYPSNSGLSGGSAGGSSGVGGMSSYINASGNTAEPATTASLSGSSNISGSSNLIGSGTVWDTRPNYMDCQYLIKVI